MHEKFSEKNCLSWSMKKHVRILKTIQSKKHRWGEAVETSAYTHQRQIDNKTNNWNQNCKDLRSINEKAWHTCFIVDECSSDQQIMYPTLT